MADDLLINGTSLSAVGRIVQDFGTALGGAPRIRNAAEEVPRRVGSIPVDSVTGSSVLSVRMLLLGDTGSSPRYTRPQYHTTARALRALVFNNGRAFTLTRTIVTASGTLTHTATARYLRGFESLEQVAAHGGRISFDLEIFGGFFYGAQVTGVATGAQTYAGDATTRRIVLHLPSAGTLTNTTLGCSVTLASVAADLTVDTFTASAGIADLSWSGDDYWFALAPGSNTVTWSGTGSATIDYYPAYL